MLFDFKVNDGVKFTDGSPWNKDKVYTVTEINLRTRTANVSTISEALDGYVFHYDLSFDDFRRLGAVKVDADETKGTAESFRKLEQEALAGLTEVTETMAMVLSIGALFGEEALHAMVSAETAEMLITAGDAFSDAAQKFANLATMAELFEA